MKAENVSVTSSKRSGRLAMNKINKLKIVLSVMIVIILTADMAVNLLILRGKHLAESSEKN